MRRERPGWSHSIGSADKNLGIMRPKAPRVNPTRGPPNSSLYFASGPPAERDGPEVQNRSKGLPPVRMFLNYQLMLSSIAKNHTTVSTRPLSIASHLLGPVANTLSNEIMDITSPITAIASSGPL